MYFLDASETEKYVNNTCGFSANRIKKMAPPFEGSKTTDTVDFSNVSSRALIPLCRKTLTKVSPSGLRIFWILSLGNWPSQENRHAFVRLRLSYGEIAPNYLKPGHLFEDFETPDLVTYFEMAVRYGWDAVLMHHKTAPLLYLNGDGQAHIYEPADINPQG